MVPGIQDKNSKPVRSFFIAKSERDLSKTALPAIIVFSPNREILLKFLLNFITTPSNNSSFINVFEPAPSIKIFSFLFNFFKKFTNSFKLSAL